MKYKLIITALIFFISLYAIADTMHYTDYVKGFYDGYTEHDQMTLDVCLIGKYVVEHGDLETDDTYYYYKGYVKGFIWWDLDNGGNNYVPYDNQTDGRGVAHG